VVHTGQPEPGRHTSSMLAGAVEKMGLEDGRGQAHKALQGSRQCRVCLKSNGEYPRTLSRCMACFVFLKCLGYCEQSRLAMHGLVLPVLTQFSQTLKGSSPGN
jgi:hypothetical protein